MNMLTADCRLDVTGNRIDSKLWLDGNRVEIKTFIIQHFSMPTETDYSASSIADNDLITGGNATNRVNIKQKIYQENGPRSFNILIDFTYTAQRAFTQLKESLSKERKDLLVKIQLFNFDNR